MLLYYINILAVNMSILSSHIHIINIILMLSVRNQYNSTIKGDYDANL